MKTESKRFDLSLQQDAMLRLPDAAGVQIVCQGGTLWITLEGDPRDVVLEAGGRFAPTEHRRALIAAMVPSSLSMYAVPAAARTPRERDRKPASVVFEQVPA